MTADRRIRSLAVVIPVRGAPAELLEQLDALAEQQAEGSWEIVLADNGGGDLAALVARANDPGHRVRIVDATTRPGQAAAINLGIHATETDGVLLLDADDVVDDRYVETMWRALDAHPFVGARLDCDALNPGWLRRSRPPTQTEGLGAPFGFLPSAAGCSIGVWREAFDRVGGFDEGLLLGNDVDFSWRLQLSGFDPVFVPDAVVRYRYRPGIWSSFRQALTYGAAGPALYARYRALGMPRRGWRRAARFHLAALWRLATARSKEDLAAASFLLGFRAGVVRGVIRNRTIYL